jgi:hypothetical protein
MGMLRLRVARFFLVQYTKTGKNLPNGHEIDRNANKIPTSSNARPSYVCARVYNKKVILKYVHYTKAKTNQQSLKLFAFPNLVILFYVKSNVTYCYFLKLFVLTIFGLKFAFITLVPGEPLGRVCPCRVHGSGDTGKAGKEHGHSKVSRQTG